MVDGPRRRGDVVVAGAGPAGAAAVLTLRRAGLDVLWVDPRFADLRPEPRFKVGESLPGAARPLLRDLGVLDRVEAGPHAAASGNLSAWGDGELRGVDAIRDPRGAGWHLDRARFDADLRAAGLGAGAAACAGHLRLRAGRLEVHRGDERVATSFRRSYNVHNVKMASFER